MNPNQLLLMNSGIKYHFAESKNLNANELDLHFENDSNLKREYLDFYTDEYARILRE